MPWGIPFVELRFLKRAYGRPGARPPDALPRVLPLEREPLEALLRLEDRALELALEREELLRLGLDETEERLELLRLGLEDTLDRDVLLLRELEEAVERLEVLRLELGLDVTLEREELPPRELVLADERLDVLRLVPDETLEVEVLRLETVLLVVDRVFVGAELGRDEAEVLVVLRPEALALGVRDAVLLVRVVLAERFVGASPTPELRVERTLEGLGREAGDSLRVPRVLVTDSGLGRLLATR